MSSLSVVIITKNEEANLRRCLESVAFADEIIVIDSQSTDRTLEIAREFGAECVLIEWTGYGPAKQEGVRRASKEWILNVDADEVVTPELAREIQSAIKSSDHIDGYSLGRRTEFMGRWIYHCGWYPDYVLRLFKKDSGNFDSAKIHEKVVLNDSNDGNSRKGKLRGDLLHYCFTSMEQYLEKQNRYTSLGAMAAYKQGKRTGWFDLVLRPPISFISHYFFKTGFRDGLEGLIISFLSSVSVFLKYCKLYYLDHSKETEQQWEENE